jgi:DNA-binding NarL/FixJ family response regulator
MSSIRRRRPTGQTAQRRRGRIADFGAALRATRSSLPPDNTIEQKRALVADFCRLVGARVNPKHHPQNHTTVEVTLPKLSPRVRQTLAGLLAGDSEKQIARRLELSPHTVHVYVKALYRGFAVSSRGELLAKFVRQPVE